MTMLKIKNLTKSFGGIKALDKCSFSVKENTITSVIGPNGAGKTTLFNVVNGLEKPESGEIFFKGKDISRLRTHNIANLGVSRTFQQARIFKNMSLRDNLSIAGAKTEDDAKRLLKEVYLHKPLEAMAGELSYGQQRLLEIARALAKEHKLLMLDEPTAGVNPKIRQELKAILKRLKKEGKTVLLIEHDMDFVMDISDEVIVLNEGKLLKEGKPEEVRKDAKVLEAYLGK